MAETLLVVDDNPRVLRSYARILEQSGYTPIPASSGAEALERFAQVRPAIVLTDVRMPGVDGFELLSAVLARDPDVEVILITGHGDMQMAIQAMRAGATDLLLKPVHPDVLCTTLERAVARLHLKRTLHAAHTALEAQARELDARVQARTAELEAANRQLQQEIRERQSVEDALRRYAEEQAALYIVTSAIAGHLEITPLLEAALDAILPTLRAPAGWVFAPGKDAASPPRLLAQRGISEELAQALTAHPLSAYPISSQVFATSVTDTVIFLNQTPPALLAAQEQAGLRASVAVPIRAAQRTLALLVLAWDRPQSEAALPRNLLSTIGYQLGLAMRNAHLYEEARQADRLRSINAISTAAIASLDPERVLRQVMTLTCQALDAAEGSILLRDMETDELVFSQTLCPAADRLLGQRVAPGQGLAGWVAAHRDTLCINDVTQEPRWFGGMDEKTGFQTRSLLATPLLYHGEVTGVMEIVNKRRGGFSEEDAHLLEAVAAIAAIALENARLYTDLKHSLHRQEETQAQLVHAEKIGAVGRLAASVAHEINNPLQAVTGYLDLAVEKIEQPERLADVQRYLGTTRREIGRISDIVRRMQEFYRPAQAGFRPTDIHAVLESVLVLARQQLRHHHIQVKEVWDTTLPPIQANADQLKQVFLNLVINAIDAMPDGGVLSIITEATTDARAAPAIRIIVRDTGSGMPETTRERLFEPFFTTKKQGMGLGLSISYGIIQAHNGQMHVESALEEGTAFTVVLPNEEPPQPPESVT